MTTWNDVLIALTRNPTIQTLTPIPGTVRALKATITTQNHGEITMTIENETDEQWLQFTVAISSDTTDTRIWHTSSDYLKNIPAIGLAQANNGIVICHGVHLRHASSETINAGIAHVVTAAAILYDTAAHHTGPKTQAQERRGNPHMFEPTLKN